MNIVERLWDSDSKYRVTVVPGKHAIVECFVEDRFVAVQKFAVGDSVKFDGSDLYEGRITSIGKTTITVSGKHPYSWLAPRPNRRYKAEEFACRVQWDFSPTARFKRGERSELTRRVDERDRQLQAEWWAAATQAAL
jgi:hypothetical protein